MSNAQPDSNISAAYARVQREHEDRLATMQERRDRAAAETAKANGTATPERCKEHHLLRCPLCASVASTVENAEKTAIAATESDAAETAEPIASTDSSTLTPEPTATTRITAAPPKFEGFETIALRNAALGYRVFPLDMSDTKKPHIKGFPKLATQDPEQIRQWAARFPNASVGLLAMREGDLFIDEDISDEFRVGYETFSGEPFPRTRTTQSRPNHRQSHWVQTDYTRAKLRNIVQGKTLNQMFSLRFHNLYVAGEGSHHPKGSLYEVYDDSPAALMPNKMADYILSLVVEQGAAVSSSVPPSVPPFSTSAQLTHDDGLPMLPRFDVMLGDGQRNDGVSQYVYWLVQDVSDDWNQIQEWALQYAHRYCLPGSEPFEDSEVIAIVNGKRNLKVEGANALRIGDNKVGTGGTVGTSTPNILVSSPSPEASAPEKPATPKPFTLEDVVEILAKHGAASAEVLKDLHSRFVPSSPAILTAQPAGDATTQKPAKDYTDEELFIQFPSLGDVKESKTRAIVERVLMAGSNFFGTPAGTIKSWASLSAAKAVTTGEPLFGVYPVVERMPVLYLCPETYRTALKARAHHFRLDEGRWWFHFRTVDEGRTMRLNDPLVIEMANRMRDHTKCEHVLIIVDTLVRFLLDENGKAADESSATSSTIFAEAADLRFLGMDILFDHHSRKRPTDKKVMNEKAVLNWLTLDNVIRGTGDFGAMADTVWGMARNDAVWDNGRGETKVIAKCVKPRDFLAPDPFRLVLWEKSPDGNLTSAIERAGDLVYEPGTSEREQREPAGFGAARFKNDAEYIADAVGRIRQAWDEQRQPIKGKQQLAALIGLPPKSEKTDHLLDPTASHWQTRAEGKSISYYPRDVHIPTADELAAAKEQERREKNAKYMREKRAAEKEQG